MTDIPHERRKPEHHSLRRLILAGNLLAAHAREGIATPSLAESWDRALMAFFSEIRRLPGDPREQKNWQTNQPDV